MKKNYEVPKDKLRPGVIYKKVYGETVRKQKKLGQAPAHLVTLPHLEWNDNKP